MRTALRVAAICGLGLALLIVGAIAYVAYVMDWSRLGDPLAGRASEALGRELRIAGDIDVDLGLTTNVSIEGVKLANASWGEAPALMEIERVEFALRLPELLRGRVVLPDLRLVRPALTLERNAAGENNWTFEKGPAAEAATPEERTEFPIIGRLHIEDGRLRYRDEERRLDIEAKIATAAGKGQPATEMIELSGEGELQGEPLRLDFVGGSILMLREEDEPYPFEGALQVGKTRLEFAGAAMEPVKLQQVDARLRLRGPNMGALFPILGIPAPDTPPYDVSGRLVRDDQQWRFADIQGVAGGSDLAGELYFDTSGERLFISGDLTSAKLDLADLGVMVGAVRRDGGKAARNRPKPQAGESGAAQRRVLPDAPLDFERVRAVDAKLSFRGKKVDAGALPLDDVELALELKDGVLKLAPLSFGFAGGRLDYRVVLDARTPAVPADHDIRLRNAQLGRILAEAGLKDAGEGRFEGRIEMRTVGDTIRKALASADGRAALVMAGGSIQAIAVEALGLDVAESLALLATEAGAPTPIRCAVAGFEVADGMMTSQLVLLDTVDSKITADAVINLRDETYQARALAHPKDASLLSARAPVTVNGTFTSANVGVEPGGVAAKGAAALALGALLTPLAAILPFIEPGLAEDADCASLVNEMSKRTRAN